MDEVLTVVTVIGVILGVALLASIVVSPGRHGHNDPLSEYESARVGGGMNCLYSSGCI
jgi:hypothetical protein